MGRLLTTLILLTSLAPAGVDAAGKRGPAVAVWDLHVADEHRTEASHWYARVVEAISAVPELRADSGRVFRPSVRPAEGLVVASTNGSVWLEAAWAAYRGGELDAAALLVSDAIRLVEPYPASRLPEGLVRDLHLLRGRILLDTGLHEAARAAVKAALLLDPTWTAERRWERPDLVTLWDSLAQERDAMARGRLIVDTVEPGAVLLVYGVAQGVAGPDGTAELDLPAGLYEITARKPGLADRTERVHLRASAEQELDLALSVRNSAGFQEALADALRRPGAQHGSAVWPGLASAADAVDSEAILVGRYVAHEHGVGGDLQIGLFLPGRAGWGWYAAIPISRDLAADQRRVDLATEDLVLRLRARLAPDEALATR